MGGGLWNLWVNSLLVTGVSDCRTCDQHLRVWAVLRDPAHTLWFLRYLYGFSVRSELTSEMGSGCWETGCCWQRPHMFGVGDNTQTHSSLSFVSGMRVRTLRLYYVGQSTQNPLPVLCIFRIPGRIMYLIKCTVTCPDPTTDMFSVLGKSSALSSPEQGDQVTWVFWKDNQWVYRAWHSWSMMSSFPHNVLVQKNYLHIFPHQPFKKNLSVK